MKKKIPKNFHKQAKPIAPEVNQPQTEQVVEQPLKLKWWQKLVTRVKNYWIDNWTDLVSSWKVWSVKQRIFWVLFSIVIAITIIVVITLYAQNKI